ncbi:ribbon-helix-helix protein, CopG family [Rhodococcus sp. NPDC049939]|uniref:ribbon-helix-helix protein, CopG family n=1 Tax=Rhodococcus sp. NPDC049939 TaxID=3155511 RepID=UPI0033C24423
MNEEIDEEYYWEYARQIEEMEIPEPGPTALYGEAAQKAARKTLAKALGIGQPGLDPDTPGDSPRRQVRLPRDISDKVDRLAEETGRKPSEVMREAITLYVNLLP